jgi:hypothetical protein
MAGAMGGKGLVWHPIEIKDVKQPVRRGESGAPAAGARLDSSSPTLSPALDLRGVAVWGGSCVLSRCASVAVPTQHALFYGLG